MLWCAFHYLMMDVYSVLLITGIDYINCLHHSVRFCHGPLSSFSSFSYPLYHLHWVIIK